MSDTADQMSTPMPDSTPRPPQRPRRRWWRLVVALVVVALVYAGVVTLYAASGRVTSTGDALAPPPGGVTVVMSPQAVDAVGQTITMDITINPSSALEDPDSLGLRNPLSIIIAPVVGNQVVTFAADTVPGSQSVKVMTTGEVEKWPLDRYVVPSGQANPGLTVVAFTTADGKRNAVPTHVVMTGSQPGWTLSAKIVDGENVVTSDDGTTQAVPLIDLQAQRSVSTLVFAVLLLSLLIAMPVLVLYVAITAYSGRRKVEATLTSWMGAMLFAVIPLRGFLPGSPPIGSWIDFLRAVGHRGSDHGSGHLHPGMGAVG